MKSYALGLALFASTAAAVALYPEQQPARVAPPATGAASLTQIPQPKVEVVFALDTTGSMGGLLGWSTDIVSL